jgi:hypothetical protein
MSAKLSPGFAIGVALTPVVALAEVGASGPAPWDAVSVPSEPGRWIVLAVVTALCVVAAQQPGWRWLGAFALAAAWCFVRLGLDRFCERYLGPAMRTEISRQDASSYRLLVPVEAMVPAIAALASLVVGSWPSVSLGDKGGSISNGQAGKRARWVALNLSGMTIYLSCASVLWVLPGEEHLPGGPGDAFYWAFVLVPILASFLVLDVVTFVVILVRRGGERRRSALFAWVAVLVLWVVTVAYDHHRAVRDIDPAYAGGVVIAQSRGA